MSNLKIAILIFSVETLALVACSDMGSNPPNRAPEITSASTVEAVMGDQFVYTATAVDPDEDEISITIENNPSWTTVAGDTVRGMAIFSTPDTSFTVIASDGELADTAVVMVAVVLNPSFISYSGEIQPIFDDNCAGSGCHIPGPAFELYLNNYDELMQGGNSGPVVIPGDPDSSIIIRRLEGDLQPRMPFLQPPLPDTMIQKIRDWIEQGALDN